MLNPEALLVLLLTVSLTPPAVRFQGNRSFSDRTLLPLLGIGNTPLLNEGELQRGIRTLADWYRAQGFLDAAVDWQIDSSATPGSVLITIHEGHRTRVRQVRITGMQSLGAHDLYNAVVLRSNHYLLAADISRGRNALIDLCRDQGYFFAECSVQIERANGTPPVADVIYQVKEGPLCFLSSITVRGNISVSRQLIDRYISFRRGERYSQRKIIAAQRRLQASRLFDRVYVKVARSGSGDSLVRPTAEVLVDSVDIRIDVSEIPARGIGFGLGLQLLPWRGLVTGEWENLNVFSRGHNLKMEISYSPLLGSSLFRDYRLEGNGTYRIPFATGWAVNLMAKPFAKWESKSGRYNLSYGAESGASHDFTPNLNLALTNRLNWIAAGGTNIIHDQTTIRGITNSLGAVLTYDTRNDLFVPSRGIYLRPALEVAGGVLGGNNRFYRLVLESRGFQRVLFNHILGLRAMLGAVLPYGGITTVPYYEQFYLGGANSLRGYDEKSIGPNLVVMPDTQHYGWTVINTNIEFRSPSLLLQHSVVKGIGGVIFLDGGTIFGNESGFQLPGYEIALGGGLRINTPIGPLRLDYGRKLLNPPPGYWGRVYLGLLNMF